LLLQAELPALNGEQLCAGSPKLEPPPGSPPLPSPDQTVSDLVAIGAIGEQTITLDPAQLDDASSLLFQPKSESARPDKLRGKKRRQRVVRWNVQNPLLA